MFKVGDFSKLSRVSVKTLHHYDEIGLFKPVHIDPATGYRYYSSEQLPRLNRILALKDLGFSLEQVTRMVDESLPAEQIRGMLRLRKAELQEQAEAVNERLARVESRLRQIEQEGQMSSYEVILKRVDSTRIASARKVVPGPELMREQTGRLCEDVGAMLNRTGAKVSGPWLAVYHESDASGIDVEMGVFVDTDLSANGPVTVRELPTVETMASSVYHGSYDAFDTVGQVYQSLAKWIETNGYRIIGPCRELYLQPPDFSRGETVGVMEIQFPVEKA